MRNKKYIYYSQLSFLIVLIIFFGINGLKILINSNVHNEAENRTSYKIEKPSFDKIISREYQDDLEIAIGDQMLKYNYFKKFYSRLSGFANLKTISLFKMNANKKYINLKNIQLIGNSLVYGFQDYDGFVSTAKNDVEQINKIIENTKANIYLYFVKTDTNFNFEKNEPINPEEYLKENLKLNNERIKTLNFNSYEEYKEYFYSIDHHWNHIGSYKGYLEMADMMNLDNKLEPEEEVCFNNAKSQGSKISKIGNYNFFKEVFCKYEFKLPEYEIYIDKKLSQYGTATEELKQMSDISYANIYGGDYGEILFINKNINSDRNLLIYSNSFSNAVNKLLASHYKTTYVIDGRHYKQVNLVDYIKENNIDDVLIIGNSMLFWDDIDW